MTGGRRSGVAPNIFSNARKHWIGRLQSSETAMAGEVAGEKSQ